MTTRVDDLTPVIPTAGRARRTVPRLLEAALSVFAERGYAAARVDDIARAAGTAHGTFYLYFANKRAVYVALARCLAEELSPLARVDVPAEGLDDEESVTALRDHLLLVNAVYSRYWPVIRAWIQREVADEELADLAAELRDRLLQNVAARIARANPEVDPVTAAQVLVTMVERFLRDAATQREPVNLAGVNTLATVAYTGFLKPVAVAAR